MERLLWERQSSKLWTAEHDGRRFRIERTSSTYYGAATVREVDERQRTVQAVIVGGYREGMKVADEWVREPK